MGLFSKNTKEEKEAKKAQKELKRAVQRAEALIKKDRNALDQAFREGRITMEEWVKRTGEVSQSHILAQVLPTITNAQTNAQQTAQPTDKLAAHSFNDRDIKMLADACMLAVQKCQNEDTLKHLTNIGEKLRARADFTKLDVSVIAACLQAYNEEMSAQMRANPNTTLVPKLREEKEYLSVLVNKLIEYAKTAK